MIEINKLFKVGDVQIPSMCHRLWTFSIPQLQDQLNRNKVQSLLAFVWNRKTLYKAYIKHSLYQLDLLHQHIEGNISLDFTLHLKAKQFAFENLITSTFPPNPLMVWVFLATEITLDYRMKCSSGENCVFQDVCTIQLSNIHTVMILKESTECREIGSKIKALGCSERRRPKDSSLTYLIPRMGY